MPESAQPTKAELEQVIDAIEAVTWQRVDSIDLQTVILFLQRVEEAAERAPEGKKQ